MSETEIVMSFIGFANPDQFSSFCQNDLFCPFYDKLNEFAQENSSIVRWMSPVVGIADGVGKLIVIIGSVFEAAIKGTCNLAVGVITFNDRILTAGSLQLFLLIPARILSILIHLPLTLLLTKRVMFDPEKATKEKAERYRGGPAFV